MTAKVRMYRQGLGDCFLLQLPGADGAPAKTVLIDCGALLGSDVAQLRECVTHLVEATARRDGRGHIDVVVATHEHWDHVSGFAQAADLFDRIDFGEVWFAWTELPGDALAERLRRERAERRNAIAAALELWRTRTAEDASPALALRIAGTAALLGFFGAGDLATSRATVVGARATTRDALAYLKERKEPNRYLEPGRSFTLPGTEVRVYVLGPPRDEQLLRKSRPSKRDAETYAEDAARTAATSFLAAVEAIRAGRAVRDEHPFDAYHRITDAERTSLPTHALYADPAADWRRIDHDWLGAASELALQLDDDTNNTSLVLAFELAPDGDVLLFAADAQVGNWLSWKDMTFQFTARGVRRSVTTAELLARTVLYKVGHHASHNATLREHGLEKMTHERLVAMIPVERTMAAKQRWAMPFGPLYERLGERCRGRVLRLDDGMPTPDALRALDGDEATAFRAAVVVDPRFVELTVGG